MADLGMEAAAGLNRSGPAAEGAAADNPATPRNRSGDSRLAEAPHPRATPRSVESACRPGPARAPSGREAPHRRVYAALDLGTNNCRLLMARPVAHGEFQVVDAFSRIVRLGEGLVQTGRLSDEAMDRAVIALATCADKLARRGATQVRSVATEAVRRARNGPEFVYRVWQETGLALDVITPSEEARLAVVGCQTLLDPEVAQSLVFDIGGGSTEVALLERDDGGHVRGMPLGVPGIRMRAWVSVPWGVVSLAETEPRDSGSPIGRLDAYARMKSRVAGHLQPLARRLGPKVQLLGASGTVTTLASLHLGLQTYDRRQVDGTIAPTQAMRELSHSLAIRSPAERAAIPGIGQDRSDLVVAGCAILEALMDLTPAPSLRVADRGIREGILRSLMARDAAADRLA